MRSYIFGVFVFFAALLSFNVVSLTFFPVNIVAEYWLRPMIIEKEAIAAERPSSRILLFGGSSVLFSIDAARIERETGVPTVNFGLTAHLRLERILREADKVAHPRDLVVLALENDYYDCQTYNWIWTPWSLRNALAWDREDFFAQPLTEQARAFLTGGSDGVLLDQWLGLARRVPANRAEALEPREAVLARWHSGREQSRNFEFSPFNIDANGDMMHTDGTKYYHDTRYDTNLFSPDTGTEGAGICPATERMLTAFVVTWQRRGVRVVFAHPPLLILDRPAPGWREAENEFRAAVTRTGAGLLDDRSELFFPRSAFFNSRNHLNAAARTIRTERMISDLRRSGLVPPQPSSSAHPGAAIE